MDAPAAYGSSQARGWATATVEAMPSSYVVSHTGSPQCYLKSRVQEFLLWHNGIGSFSGALGLRFDPWPGVVGLRIWHCQSWSLGHDCGWDLSPGQGTPYAKEQPKKKKSRLQKDILSTTSYNNSKEQVKSTNPKEYYIPWLSHYFES